MLRAIKIRLYPNKEQATMFNKLLGCYRVVYNQCLSRKIESYKNEGKTENLSTLGQFVHHELLKNDNFIWLREQNTKVLKQAVKDMLTAYKNFFEQHTGYPKFKSKHDNKQSCRFELRISTMPFKEILIGRKHIFHCLFENLCVLFSEPNEIIIFQ